MKKKKEGKKGKKGDVGKVFETVVKSIFRCLEKPRFPRKFSNTRGDDSMKEINKKQASFENVFLSIEILAFHSLRIQFFFLLLFVAVSIDETDGSNKIFQTNTNDSHVRMNIATRSSEHFEYLNK